MNSFNFPGMVQLKGFMKAQTNQLIGQKRPQLFNLFLFSAILLLLQQKEVSLNFNINGPQNERTQIEAITVATGSLDTSTPAKQNEAEAKTVSTKTKTSIQTAKAYIGSGLMSLGNKLSSASQVEKTTSDNLSNTYSNMTYHEKEQANTVSAPQTVGSNSKSEKYLLKRKKQEAYVARFHKVAQSEMRKYGIPASITLAQGLIESNAGDSRLSKRNNNHFGMKCFSKKCSKGHCSNFTDDSHKDFFRKYETVWESFRAHSILLTGKRYRRLFKLQQTDYKGWATGLKKAGYATDPKYAQKLIHIIQELELNKYDEI